MYTINPYQLQKSMEMLQSPRWDCGIEATCAALKLYRRARNQSLLGRLWMLFTGRDCHLLDLALVRDSCSVRERTYTGMRAVPLGQIRGSEGRYLDFDGSFMPLRSEDRQRWLNVAAAHLMGVALPPVVLIQVRDIYFVRDGHHRISVAQALGQKVIDAEVVLWQVVGSVPWEPVMLADRGLGQPASA